MTNYEKFDKMVDLDGLKKDLEEAKENGGGNYKDVPLGEYEVGVTKLELDESKKGDPMIKLWFKILDGEFKNSLLFYNQVITQGFQIHLTNELLKSFDTGVDIEFKSYSQYAQLLMDVHEKIDGSLEFKLKYGEKKGFKTFEILEVFEVE